MASGLSRRRVGNASGTADSNPTAFTSTPTNGATSPLTSGYAGTALEGGSKIAFDPRDLDNEGETNKMPKLTLMEEVLLLGLNDRQVRVTRPNAKLARSPGPKDARALTRPSFRGRAICHSGTIISRTRYEDALSWNWRSVDELQ